MIKRIFISLIGILTIGILFVVFSGGTPLKYDDYIGKDTVDYFGDGAVQIMSGYDEHSPNQLSNSLMNFAISDYNAVDIRIRAYCVEDDYVYTIGEKGYTMVNFKTYDVKQSIDLKSFDNNHQQIFLQLINK